MLLPGAKPLAFGAAALLLLSGCAGGRGDSPGSPHPPRRGISDTPQLIGNPYMLGGRRYIPADTPDYDEVGFASWYGSELRGNPTAYGEAFAPEGITAAHRTLPLPSYVEVTRLDTGRTILVRINDRGPVSSNRLIDLSAGAARQLGITEMGTAAVRVRRVEPSEREREALRRGRRAVERPTMPESELRPLRDRASRLPRSTGLSVDYGSALARAARGTYPEFPFVVSPLDHSTEVPNGLFVQAQAFSSRTRASALAQRAGVHIGESGSVNFELTDPLSSQIGAQNTADRARQLEHSGAHIQRTQ